MERFKCAAERLELGWGKAPGGETRGLCFQQCPDRVNFGKLLRSKGLEYCSTVAAQLDQPHGGQFQKRLAHGSPADGKELRDSLLREAFATPPAALEQAVDDARDYVGLAGGLGEGSGRGIQR